jgi:selT/selW/selH-like putative selenoprotein
VAAGLARLIEDTGWDLSVELDKTSPSGEFTVYLDDERIFSRFEQGRLPEPLEIIPAIRARLFSGAPQEEGSDYGSV